MWFRVFSLHFSFKYLHLKILITLLKTRDDVYVSLFRRKFSQNMTSLFCTYRCSFINYYDKNPSTNQKSSQPMKLYIGPFICTAFMRATKIILHFTQWTLYLSLHNERQKNLKKISLWQRQGRLCGEDYRCPKFNI